MPHEGSPRWKFRKGKKLERRKKKRQEAAEQREEPVVVEEEEENTKYEQQKAEWEANEIKHKIIESARLKAKRKEEEARKLAQKKWQETLLSLPLTDKFPKKKETLLKTFISERKTYRERFLEAKKR
ncbi:unnamed protein product [Rhizopus stolonifer]